MQTIIILLVATQLVISAAAALAPKLRIPAPLILVIAGIGVGVIPGVPDVVIDPHIIMLGLLPRKLSRGASVSESGAARELREENRRLRKLLVSALLETQDN